MELYVMRHGIAEDVSASGRDEDRQLTPEGRKKLREIVKVAGRAGLRPSLVVSSPYVRALQTAKIAAEELGYDGDIVRSDALTPEADPEDVWTEVRSFRESKQVLLASHNPLCAELAAYLLQTPELWIDFKKGAIVRIDIEQFGPRPHGLLRWMLAPRLAQG